MKKFLKIIAVIIVLVIVLVLVAGLFLPNKYHLEKEITINAPREKVWSNVSTLAALHKWSPWIETDPHIKVSYEGHDGTVGAVYKWEGNSDVGQGSQTITSVGQPDNMNTHLHFLKPFEGEADAFIKLSDAGTGTKVSWGFDSEYGYPMNVMPVVMNMDKMMGDTYNKGLSKLKALCELN